MVLTKIINKITVQRVQNKIKRMIYELNFKNYFIS